MLYRNSRLTGALAALALLAACSSGDGLLNDTPRPENPSQTLVTGSLAGGGADFDLSLDLAGTPDLPVPGPFVVHGRNLRIEPATGDLALDLSVVNASGASLPLPVGLTFTRLLPDSVRVVDADNGETGAGAAIVFGFANDDLQWTPGEESLPRTVRFTLPAGGAVAFHALVNVGAGPLTGLIGGVVFEDGDGDGIRSDFEGPLAGVRVVVTSEPEPMPAG
ncbi:MAG TPA: hypothetical protein PLQ13_12380, partial [Candidatus Krumholzibacteria bacterium]|nr:hypothetical protein [Candidatus Krumholzibacteria bacterium]